MFHRSKFFILIICLGLLLAPLQTAAAKDAPLIGKDELKSALGKPGLVIIDVRSPKDWAGSAKKIKGAVREEAGKIEVWAKKYAPDQEIVLYCA